MAVPSHMTDDADPMPFPEVHECMCVAWSAIWNEKHRSELKRMLPHRGVASTFRMLPFPNRPPMPRCWFVTVTAFRLIDVTCFWVYLLLTFGLVYHCSGAPLSDMMQVCEAYIYVSMEIKLDWTRATFLWVFWPWPYGPSDAIAHSAPFILTITKVKTGSSRVMPRKGKLRGGVRAWFTVPDPFQHILMLEVHKAKVPNNSLGVHFGGIQRIFDSCWLLKAEKKYSVWQGATATQRKENCTAHCRD